MRQIFDLRRQLKQHDNALLQQLFAERRVLLDLSWATLKQTDVDPIMAQIMELPSGKRRELQALLQAIAKLSDSRGLKVIHEELKWRYPEKVESWTGQKNRADKALWAYLNARDAFEEAAVFARADALSTTRYFNRWSPVVTNGFEVSCERIGALKKGLMEHYSQREARGEDCAVHHYTRLNGNEYFFAYLRDWPNNFMVFNDDGELESLDLPTAFTDLFVFEPDTGALEMIASGGATVQQRLRRVFYQALCGLEVGDASPQRPEYLLDHLLLPDFAFRLVVRDRIESVTVPRILLFPKSVSVNSPQARSSLRSMMWIIVM
jgi:hypothetical protein